MKEKKSVKRTPKAEIKSTTKQVCNGILAIDPFMMILIAEDAGIDYSDTEWK